MLPSRSYYIKDKIFKVYKLNDLTKKFPKLEANILGVIRDDKFII